MKPAKHDQQKFQPARHRVIPMFSTPFLRGELDFPSSMVMRDIDRIVDKVKDMDDKNKLCNYTSYFDNDVREETHKLGWFRDFSNIIKDTYIEFVKTQFNRDIRQYCRDDIHLFAWVNVYNEPHSHSTHNHVNSLMSGTYYIKTNENAQQIKFTSPNICVNANHQAVDRPLQRENYPDFEFDGVEGCDSYARYQPREQEFLLWPSYIQHEVPAVDPSYQQEGDLGYERISLSFNLKHRLPIDNNQTGDNLSYDFLEENVNA
jgi:uncharacterized protein (TIGR02466 family)